MNLRACFPRLQLLFLPALAVSILLPESAQADAVVTIDGRRQDPVKIVGVTAGSLQVQIGTGTMGIPLVNVKEVQMPAPTEVLRAQQLFAAKDYAKALATIRPVVEKFKGLPTEWAQQSTGLLGDLYVVTEDLPKAEAAYKEFQKLYPGAGGVQAEVGMARILISKGQLAEAKAKLEPIADAALKEKFISRASGYAYSQTFLALGQIKEKEGKLPEALEDYLRTVTLFYHDPSAVSLAQERADTLIEQKVSVP